MKRLFDLSKRVLPALVAMAVLVVTTQAPVFASQESIHAHINANGLSDNLRCKDGTFWSNLQGTCYGQVESSPAAQFLSRSVVTIKWTSADGPQGLDNPCLFPGTCTKTLPSGYTRWMRICVPRTNRDLCEFGTNTTIYGAVRMPNGPFTVIGGTYGGCWIEPSDPNAEVESRGGPLYVYVGYDGPGEYVFGIRGYLEFKPKAQGNKCPGS